tara:strand:- start:7425 stop:10034 length:2610 start_codon:yes stop_codon:yes gene_type:complete
MDRLAELAGYAQSFPGMVDDDFIAAGFTPEEISSYRSQTAPQFEQFAPTGDTLAAPDYTLRERMSQGSQDILSNTFGMDPYRAGVLSRNVLGNPNASRNYGMGLADFTPLGAVFATQEGSRTASRGYEAGDPLQMGLGGLEMGLGLAEAFPLARFAATPLKRAISEIADEVLTITDSPVIGEIVGNTRAAMGGDIDFILGRGDPALAQGVGADVPGRPPLTFDEVEAAMRAEAPASVPAQVGSPEVSQAPIDQQVVDAPRITPRDLEGARIIPTVADLTRAGGFYTGIDSSVIDIPEVMMGGPGFPLLPSSQENGLIWAVQGKGIGTKKAGTGADLIAVTAMNPTSHKSNISFINSLIKTTDAYVRDGRIGSNVISALDDAIVKAGAGGDASLTGLSRFPGFKSPNAQEFIDNASFQERSRIASIIGSKEMQEAGAPNVNRVLEATADPKYAGANPRDTLLFIEPDFSLPPVDLAAEGLPVHPSYRYGIRGRVFGALDQNISTFEMFPTFWGEKNINAFGEDFNTGGRRAFDMSLPIEEVTGEQVSNLERIMTMEAAGATNLSAIDTRLLVNSLTGNWKPTTTSVKAGGASPQAFVDAINNNKYKPALTNYSPQEIKAGARSGDLVAYQLGDDEVFFALDSKPDYSWAGVDMQEGDKAIVGVVSNAPGSKGTAAPSVIAKALDEGANILDAFAVPSKSFPDGFLPEYYGEFGFEEVGRVPFDRDMYVADHGELAYEDLLEAWRSDGWDESMGMPPVIVMRWSGSDADRAATSAGIRGAGSPSHRAKTEGFVAEAEGSAGRISDEIVPQGTPSVGSGDTGQAGTGDGFRLSNRSRAGAEGLLGLTPEQLRNRGIPEGQIQQLMELSKIGQ